MAAQAGGSTGNGTPAQAGLVRATLILVAGVANLNLSVANVVLPSRPGRRGDRPHLLPRGEQERTLLAAYAREGGPAQATA